MGYQSKTYSLSDEVVEAIEAAKAKGVTPNQLLRSALLVAREADVGSVRSMVAPTISFEGSHKPDVDYATDELPSGGSVGLSSHVEGAGTYQDLGRSGKGIQNWRAGRKPLMKPKEQR